VYNKDKMKMTCLAEIAKRNNISERSVYGYKAYYDKLREK